MKLNYEQVTGLLWVVAIGSCAVGAGFPDTINPVSFNWSAMFSIITISLVFYLLGFRD